MADAVVQINTGLVNVFLIRGDTGCVLVDAGNPGHAGLILKLMRYPSGTPNLEFLDMPLKLNDDKRILEQNWCYNL